VTAVHERLCVSGISTWSWTLEEDLAYYAARGVHTVGVALRKLEDDEGAVGRIRDSGLRVANLIGLGPFDLARPRLWPAQRDRLRAAVDTAVALGARTLVLTTGPATPLSWEDAAQALGDALGTVPQEARAAEVSLALEHTNSLRPDVGFVHRLADVIDVAEMLDVDVCMEVNACWGERSLAATIAAGVDRIAVVQVSDYAVGTLCTPDRRVPGDGDIPLERILGTLLQAGYRGVFDLELIGPAIEREGYASAVDRSLENLGRTLRALGA
jgi:sugar phosphate isomerase/epimerase